MSAPRRRGSDDPGAVLVWSLLGLGAAVVAVTNVAERAAGRAGLSRNPLAVTVGIGMGTVPWDVACTLVAVAVLAVLVGLVVAWVMFWPRRHRIDRAAQHMGRGRQLARLAPHAVRRASAGRGCAVRFDGLPVGVTVAGRQPVASGDEDVTLDVMGPRAGKTSSRVIPAGLAAPGWLLVTSNKRDAADHLSGPRGDVGPVWTWDPQGVASDGVPDMRWNPLSYVTDENRASQLAKLWTTSSRPADAKPDAFFDPAGEELLSHYLHAAALGGLEVTAVYRWLTRPADATAVGILREAGFALAAASVQEVLEAPAKQRAGVFGAAKRTVSFLTNTKAVAWVTAEPGDARPEFTPAEFVRSTGTLFALSREGVGDTGPLTVALTVAVCEAAEELAKDSPGGRLRVPGVVQLDEAANVCRWSTLPDLFSHYGSRGILLGVYLQSWSQGVDVWGRSGMAKLWSAATVKVVGPGVGERDFLSDVAELVGQYRPDNVSRTSSPGGGSSSTSQGSEPILTVADLAEMPPGRAIVLASGCPATLVRTVPWWKGRDAARVKASVVLAGSPQ